MFLLRLIICTQIGYRAVWSHSTVATLVTFVNVCLRRAMAIITAILFVLFAERLGAGFQCLDEEGQPVDW
ncbi:unnamed protein product [Soboliphyme baturini]|uniref:Inner membrane protein n=1 Tax=Soboliphyme baturini TaxID=241478 RepID=A0A183ITZ8_9BILA|nr:unnamed protein product [Soboliphyme baturini]